MSERECQSSNYRSHRYARVSIAHLNITISIDRQLTGIDDLEEVTTYLTSYTIGIHKKINDDRLRTIYHVVFL